jgi:hypothetical protein
MKSRMGKKNISNGMREQINKGNDEKDGWGNKGEEGKRK